MDSVKSSSGVNCHECGRVIDPESHFCQYCGHELVGEEEKKEIDRKLAEEERPLIPVLGGILIMISSLFLLATALLAEDLRDEAELIWPFGIMDVWPTWFLYILYFFVIVGMIGGLSAVMRKSQAIALIGGVVSCFGIGALIGVIGLVLVAASEDEFESQLASYTELPETVLEGALEKPGFGWRR